MGVISIDAIIEHLRFVPTFKSQDYYHKVFHSIERGTSFFLSSFRFLLMGFGLHARRKVVQSSFLALMVCCYFKGFPLLIFQKSQLWPECSINFVDSGELVCPTYKELCGEAELVMPGQCLNGCNLNGECVDGVCKCLYGFSGKDCGIREQTLHVSSYKKLL